MTSIRSSSLKTSLLLATLAVAVTGLSLMAQTQDQDTERRFWPPSYRQPAQPSAKAKPQSGRPKSKNQGSTTPITTAASKEPVVGITIWRLRPFEEIASANPKNKEQEIARILVVRKGKKSEMSAERVEASTPFATGQMLRMSIETPRSGYLYVIDREEYKDGTFSEPYLIYPISPNDDNKVEAGRVIEIPNGGDEPYFEVDPLKSGDGKIQTAEVLTVLVTDKPLTGLPKMIRNDEGVYDPLQLPEADVKKWEELWGTDVKQIELEGGAGKAYTRSEQIAGADRKKRLTENDPPPQTLFRVAAKPGKPLMLTLPLKIEK